MNIIINILISALLALNTFSWTTAPEPDFRESQLHCETWEVLEIHGEYESAVFETPDGEIEYPIFESWDGENENEIIFTINIDGELQTFGWVE